MNETTVEIDGDKFVEVNFPDRFLMNWIIQHNAIVAGSVVLKFLTNESYETNDVDILVPVDDLNYVDRFVKLLKSDFVVYKYEGITQHTIDNLKAYQYEKGIIARTDVMYKGKKYQLLFTVTDPVLIIRKWDIDVCQNYWNPKYWNQIRVFYLYAVLEKNASFINMTWRYDARKEKYEKRGYKFLPVPVPITKVKLMEIMAAAASDAFKLACTRWTPWALHIDMTNLDFINFVPTNLEDDKNILEKVCPK